MKRELNLWNMLVAALLLAGCGGGGSGLRQLAQGGTSGTGVRSEPIEISGTLRDEAERPLPGVEVSVPQALNDQAFAISSSDGSFLLIAEVSAGEEMTLLITAAEQNIDTLIDLPADVIVDAAALYLEMKADSVTGEVVLTAVKVSSRTESDAVINKNEAPAEESLDTLKKKKEKKIKKKKNKKKNKRNKNKDNNNEHANESEGSDETNQSSGEELQSAGGTEELPPSGGPVVVPNESEYVVPPAAPSKTPGLAPFQGPSEEELPMTGAWEPELSEQTTLSQPELLQASPVAGLSPGQISIKNF